MKFRLYRVLDGLGGAVCRGHVQYPDFAPDSSNVAVGFFGGFFPSSFFGLFVSSVQNFPRLHKHAVIFQSCVVYLYFAALEVSPGTSIAALQQGSQIPACLNTSFPRWCYCVHFKMIRSKMSEVKSHAQHGALPDTGSELRHT